MTKTPPAHIDTPAMLAKPPSAEKFSVRNQFLLRLAAHVTAADKKRNGPTGNMLAQFAQDADPEGQPSWTDISEKCVEAARYLCDDYMGLLKSRVPPGWFFLLAHYLASATDLRCALERLNLHSNASVTDFSFVFREESGDGYLEMAENPINGKTNDLVYDIFLIQRYKLLCWLAQVDMPITTLYLPYENRTNSDLLLSVTKSAEVVYGTDRAAIRFPLTYLKNPIIANVNDLSIYSAYFLPDNDNGNHQLNGLTLQLRQTLFTEVEHGSPNLSLDRASKLLGVPHYTLQRLFRDRGTTFQALRDKIRADASKKMLSSGRYSMTEISERIGFREPSSFSRAFKRWTGHNPTFFIKSRNH